MDRQSPALEAGLRQAQTLAPQLRQSLRVLRMTDLELRTEMRAQMERNPVIEIDRARDEAVLSEVAPDERTAESMADAGHALDFTPDGGAAEATLATDDGERDYYLRAMSSASGDEEAASRRQRLFDSQRNTETLQEHLLAQVALSDLPPDAREVAALLIGDVDSDGYFRGSPGDVASVYGMDEGAVEGVLAAIRAFDPPGCGARTIPECLLAQIDPDGGPDARNLARIVSGHLEDVAAGRRARVCEALAISEDAYLRAVALLRALDPKPGRAYASGSERAGYVTPEVFVERRDGRWVASVKPRDLPRIRISPRYVKMLSDPAVADEAKAYIRRRIEAAESLRDAVRRRQETIRLVAQGIVDAQPGFFERGFRALRPLKMQEIARGAGVVATTVSRAVRGKYMATPRGVVEMRKFFTAGLATAAGGEVSNAAVRGRVKALVEAEDPAHPLSDEKIASILQSEGVRVARRTVAKYRIALRLPGAPARRRWRRRP